MKLQGSCRLTGTEAASTNTTVTLQDLASILPATQPCHLESGCHADGLKKVTHTYTIGVSLVPGWMQVLYMDVRFLSLSLSTENFGSSQ